MKVVVSPRLGVILKKRGMTQLQLSKMTNITQGTISNFDRSRMHQDNHLFKIAIALDVSIEDLFNIVVEDEEYDE